MSVEVSVVIPSIGSAGEVHGERRVFVIDAVRSVLATTRPSMSRSSSSPAARCPPPSPNDARARRRSTVRCVDYDAEFNFSATVNLGAAHAWAGICCC